MWTESSRCESKRLTGEQKVLGVQREVDAEWARRSLMDGLKEKFWCVSLMWFRRNLVMAISPCRGSWEKCFQGLIDEEFTGVWFQSLTSFSNDFFAIIFDMVLGQKYGRCLKRFFFCYLINFFISWIICMARYIHKLNFNIYFR